MREASVILPARDNDGADLSALHLSFRHELLATYGGFTAAPVEGAWRDEATGRVYSDESTEYRIAADWTAPKAESVLERIAARYAGEMGQLAVYVRHGSGDVVFAGPVETVEDAAPAPVEAESDHAPKGRKTDRLDDAAKFDRARDREDIAA